MRRAEEFGTDGGGSRTRDYCRECFRDGRFAEPQITMEDLVERTVRGRWMREADALAFKSAVHGLLASLDRWRESHPVPLASIAAADRAERIPMGDINGEERSA